MNTSQKGFAGTVILILIALVIVGGGTYAYVQEKNNEQPAPIRESPIAQSTSTTQISTVSSDKPIITVNRTRATKGETFTFTLYKYPKTAKRWEFRFNCSEDLAGRWIYPCSESVPYYPDSQDTVTQQKMVNGQVLQATKATVDLEAYDGSGNSLGKSTVSVTIEPNSSYLDATIRTSIAYIRTTAELNYTNNEIAGNGNGYLSICNDTGLTAVMKQLKSISKSVVCKDSKGAWAISAQMQSDPSKYFCTYGPMTTSADVDGVVRSSAITTASCR